MTSLKRCPKLAREVVLRTESAPAGAPAAPPAATLFNGLTGQAVGGFRLAVTLRITTKGRVWGSWHREKGTSDYPCDSKIQTWAARP